MSIQQDIGLKDYNKTIEESESAVDDTQDVTTVETEEESEEEIKTGQQLKEFKTNNFQIIGTDGGFWPIRKNYYARIIEEKNEFITVDCLVDPINRQFEERNFTRLLFENLSDLSVGKYVIIKIFVREGKSQIVIDDAEKLVNKEIFEDKSQFSDLADIENPEIAIDSL